MRAVRGMAVTAMAWALAGVLAGCGGAGAGPKPSASASNGPDIQVTFGAYVPGKDGAEQTGGGDRARTPVR